MRIFQITREELDRDDALRTDDMGKWCFKRGDRTQIFDTRDEAEAALAAHRIHQL